MRTFVYVVLFILLAIYFNLMFFIAVDVDMAKRDYEAGKAVQGCIFDFVCERFDNV